MSEEKVNIQISDSQRKSGPNGVARKGRKSIAYLQKCKDEGKKIVQMCPSCRDEMWVLAAEMADCDIARICGALMLQQIPLEQRLHLQSAYIKSVRSMCQFIHLNHYMDTPTYASPEKAVAYGSEYMMAGADSLLPMGITNDILRYMADNHLIVYGHIGALSGWQTMATGYVKVGKTAEDAMRIYRMGYEYQENGMRCMSIELTPIEVSNAIAKKLRVPVISIAAGGACDGCEMVDKDTFTITAQTLSHAKHYADFFQWAASAYANWANDVRTGAYPEDKHGWHMDSAELERFNDFMEKAD